MSKLDKSYELGYYKKYYGKTFKHKTEIELSGMVPNVYRLGVISKSEQKVTVDWWLKIEGEKQIQQAVEYKLADVLKWIVIGDWIIQDEK